MILGRCGTQTDGGVLWRRTAAVGWLVMQHPSGCNHNLAFVRLREPPRLVVLFFLIMVCDRRSSWLVNLEARGPTRNLPIDRLGVEPQPKSPRCRFKGPASSDYWSSSPARWKVLPYVPVARLGKASQHHLLSPIIQTHGQFALAKRADLGHGLKTS